MGCCCVCVQDAFAVQKKNLLLDFQAQTVRRRWSPVGRENNSLQQAVNIYYSFGATCCHRGTKRLPQKNGKETIRSHSEGELGTVAECGVIWAVDWRLSGESGVKLAHVLVGLLQWRKTRRGWGVQHVCLWLLRVAKIHKPQASLHQQQYTIAYKSSFNSTFFFTREYSILMSRFQKAEDWNWNR